jgi:DNA-binding MarR family transcriptional regulator
MVQHSTSLVTVRERCSTFNYSRYDPGMAQAPWLNDDEARAWRSFLLASQLLLDQLDRELQADAGMPHAYYAILAVLSEQPERALRMSAIAELLRFSKSRLSHAIGRLEERGWVERVSCPTDRRGAYAVLTEAGLAALAAAGPGHVTGVRRHLFDRLTPEQVEQLRAIGEAIAGPLLATATPAARDDQHADEPETRELGVE